MSKFQSERYIRANEITEVNIFLNDLTKYNTGNNILETTKIHFDFELASLFWLPSYLEYHNWNIIFVLFGLVMCCK